MNLAELWTASIPHEEHRRTLAVSSLIVVDPYCVVACGSEILIYEGENGKHIETLKDHTDTVTCLCEMKDGRFASGSQDKQVIVWTSDLQKVLKYSHESAVLSMSFDAINDTLLSCSKKDFGLLKPSSKHVLKTKVKSRIYACSWSKEGDHFALGLKCGDVLIVSSASNEVTRVEHGQFPIRSLAWIMDPKLKEELIAVVDESCSLSFLDSKGQAMPPRGAVCNDVLTAKRWGPTETLLIRKSNGEVFLWSIEGFVVARYCHNAGPISALAISSARFCIATNEGPIISYKLSTLEIFGLEDGIAYSVSDLTTLCVTDQQRQLTCRINCYKAILNVTIHSLWLFVKVEGIILVFEKVPIAAEQLCFKIVQKIIHNQDVVYFRAVKNSLLMYNKFNLERYSFEGILENLFSFRSEIVCAVVFNGQVLICLRDGCLYKSASNDGLDELLRHPIEVQKADIDSSRLLVLGKNERITIYDHRSGTVLLEKQLEISDELNLKHYPHQTATNNINDNNLKDLISEAATVYESAGDLRRAIQVICNGGHFDELRKILERNKNIDPNLLPAIDQRLIMDSQLEYEIEIMKLKGDKQSLLTKYINHQLWHEAVSLSESDSKFNDQLRFPYTTFLIRKGRYNEAIEFNTKHGYFDQAAQVHLLMASNNVSKHQFKEAALNHWEASKFFALGNCSIDKNRHSLFSKLYLCYETVYNFVEDPFTMKSPLELLNHSKFLLFYLLNSLKPIGISLVNVLHCAAISSFRLKCFKFCKYVYQLLLRQIIPSSLRGLIKQGNLAVISKPGIDDEELELICFKCTRINPLFNAASQSCIYCSEPFIFSMHSFNALPIVSLNLPNDNQQQKLDKLLQSDPAIDSTFDFNSGLLTENDLMNCDPLRTLVIRSADTMAKVYYMTDVSVPIKMCETCNAFYTEEEWNFIRLVRGWCLLCHVHL